VIYRLPPLNALRVFEAAARHLSFKEAASELSITQAASAAAGSDRMKANANIRACSIDFSRPP